MQCEAISVHWQHPHHVQEADQVLQDQEIVFREVLNHPLAGRDPQAALNACKADDKHSILSHTIDSLV